MTDDNSHEHRLRGGTPNHYHNGEVVASGESFTPSERELELFGEKFELAQKDDSTDSGGDEGEDEEKDEDDAAESEDDEAGELTDLDGVGPATAENLRAAGYEIADDVRDAEPDALADVEGISETEAADLTTGV